MQVSAPQCQAVSRVICLEPEVPPPFQLCLELHNIPYIVSMTHVYTYIYICVHICTYRCGHIYIYTHITYLYVYLSMYVCMSVCSDMYCVCIYTHCACIIHIHTRTDTVICMDHSSRFTVKVKANRRCDENLEDDRIPSFLSSCQVGQPTSTVAETATAIKILAGSCASSI